MVISDIYFDVGINVSKKSKNMEGKIAWSIFASWFFNQTLSIYFSYPIYYLSFPIKWTKSNYHIMQLKSITKWEINFQLSQKPLLLL